MTLARMHPISFEFSCIAEFRDIRFLMSYNEVLDQLSSRARLIAELAQKFRSSLGAKTY